MIKIKDFIKNIKLNDKVLEHLKYTTNNYEEYLRNLLNYDKNAIYAFLLDLTFKENKSSSNLEREKYPKHVIDVYESLFSNNNILTEEMILNLHKAVLYNNNFKHKEPGKYRKHEVWIGNPGEGIQYAFHIPPKYEEIESYMKDFINFFNDNDNGINDIFIKSALTHVIMIKIHPFADGNGRMARLLQNYQTTILTNKKYNTDFPLSPINLSKSYDMTRLTYFKLQNNIDFYGNDNNESFNKWFDYVLTMCDEQIYYATNLLSKYKGTMEKIQNKFSTRP